MDNDIDKDIEELEAQRKKYQQTGFLGMLGEAAKKAYVDPIAAKVKSLLGQQPALQPQAQPDPRLAALQQIRTTYNPKEADEVLAKAQALIAAKESNLGSPEDKPAYKEPSDDDKAAAELRRFAKTLDSLKKP